MRYSSLTDFLRRGSAALATGPVALIFAEDRAEIDSTVQWHLDRGFKTLAVFMPDDFPLGDQLEPVVHRVNYRLAPPRTVTQAVNRVIEAAPGVWMYYCFNAEYLIYPFCETRTIGEMLTFHTEERRASMLTYVIDLYAGDLQAHPNAVDLQDAYLDQTGYYALGRWNPADGGSFLERQQDFFGGLRWRFEEHVPFNRRKIDRIGLFKSAPKLELQETHTFNEPEYNTYACPWHHNLTAAICSFRTAKALKRNPASAKSIQTFLWHNSVRFEWRSSQLLDLGLIEPGQWF